MKLSALRLGASILLVSGLTLFTGCTSKSSPEVAQADARLDISFDRPEAEDAEANRNLSVVTINNTDDAVTVVRLTNEGGQLLSIQDINTSSTTPMYFEMRSNTCEMPLPSQSFCELTVAFNGKKEGIYEQLIGITTDDIEQPFAYVKIKVEAEEKLVGVVSHDEDAGKMISPMLELDFNKLDTLKYVNVRNSGLEALKFQGTKLEGKDKKSFKVDHICPGDLEVDESCRVIVRYDADRKKGESDAILHILTNGTISPSQKIRLMGYSEPYTLKVKEFIVSKNIKEYLGDIIGAKNSYFLRTIYQTHIDASLETMMIDAMNRSLKSNGLTRVSEPNRADHIISLYPNISYEEGSTPGNLTINVGMHGFFASKAKYNKPNLVENSQVVLTQKSDHVDFTSIDTIKEFYDKEPFSFFIEIEVKGYEDKNDVYEKLSEIIAEKAVNVLGMR